MYNKTVWIGDETEINASNLNNIENCLSKVDNTYVPTAWVDEETTIDAD